MKLSVWFGWVATSRCMKALNSCSVLAVAAHIERTKGFALSSSRTRPEWSIDILDYVGWGWSVQTREGNFYLASYSA